MRSRIHAKLAATSRISAKDKSGRDHTIYVPKDQTIRVSAFSKFFRFAEPPQARNAPLKVPANGGQVKFTITGGAL
ncbi:MAG: hypothetical protein ACRD8O_04425 [Bryobacteraceae bacterium]